MNSKANCNNKFNKKNKKLIIINNKKIICQLEYFIIYNIEKKNIIKIFKKLNL